MFAYLKTHWFSLLVYAILFLLPWQTRYIYDVATIGGATFEYGMMSVYAVEVLIAIAFLFGQRFRIRKPYRQPIKAMGIVLIACAASVVFSYNRDLSFGAWSHLLFAGILFILLLDERIDKWRALQAFSFGLVVPAILGLVQTATGFSSASKWFGLAVHQAADLGAAVVEGGGGRMLRAYGSFTHPNVFGGFLTVGLLCSYFLILRARSSRARLGFSFLSFFLSFTLIATFSRSAWLAFIFACVVGIFFVLLKHRSKIRSRLPFILSLSFSLLVPILVFFQPLTNRFDSSERLEQISVQDRLSQYASYPELLKKSPVLGFGIGTYPLALSERTPGLQSWDYQPIHNTPLLIFAEVGIVGVLAILFWASRVDKVNYAAIRRGSVEAIGGIMLGSIPLVVIFFDHYIWSNWSGLALLSFLMAMTLKLSEE